MDRRRLPRRLSHGAIDSLSRRRGRLLREVVPAILVPLARSRRPEGQVETHICRDPANGLPENAEPFPIKAEK